MPPRRAAPRPVTPESLARAAADYVSRYAASTARLRQVLQRRVLRAEHAGAPVTPDAARVIEALVQRYVTAGVLDDDAWAQRRAESLRRRGESGRRIAQRLAAAGISSDAGRAALAAAAEEAGAEDGQAAELMAAIRFAQRRRIGPFRKADRTANRQRDLATMARAGFSFDLARRVVDAADADALAERGADALR
jgi:regulatory protein